MMDKGGRNNPSTKKHNPRWHLSEKYTQVHIYTDIMCECMPVQIFQFGDVTRGHNIRGSQGGASGSYSNGKTGRRSWSVISCLPFSLPPMPQNPLHLHAVCPHKSNLAVSWGLMEGVKSQHQILQFIKCGFLYNMMHGFIDGKLCLGI